MAPAQAVEDHQRQRQHQQCHHQYQRRREELELELQPAAVGDPEGDQQLREATRTLHPRPNRGTFNAYRSE